jgi:hypothetical protein
MGSPIFKNVFLQSKVPEGLSDQALQAAILESQGPLAGLKKVLTCLRRRLSKVAS